MSLTKPMAKWATEQAKARGLKTVSAYVIQLLREEQKRQAVQFLIEKLDEAKASSYHEVTDQLWGERKKRVIAQIKAAKKKAKAK